MVTPPLRSIPRAARRVAALVIAVAQLCIVLAPWADGSAGAPATAHVEEQGTRIHLAHGADACFICAVQHVGGRPPLAAMIAADQVAPPASAFGSQSSPSRATLDITSAPRAPPV